jgi:hypothetical protein
LNILPTWGFEIVPKLATKSAQNCDFCDDRYRYRLRPDSTVGTLPTPSAEGWTHEFCNFFLVLMFAAGYLYRLSKQLSLAAIPPRPSDDKRAPVLYLRAFKDDEQAQWGDSTEPLFIGNFVSQEERLVEVLRDFGPVVALGIPGEKLPGVGAMREYVSHDTWQQHVQNYMKNAALVVIRLGVRPTENLWWELKEAAAHVASDRLMLLVPRPHEYETAWRSTSQSGLSRLLPEYPDFALRRLTVGEQLTYKMAGGPLRNLEFMPKWAPMEWDLTGLIHYMPDGTACFEPSADRKGRRLNMATALRYAMKPVFQQHGVQWRDAPRDLGRIATRFFWWILSAFVIVVALVGIILEASRQHP